MKKLFFLTLLLAMPAAAQPLSTADQNPSFSSGSQPDTETLENTFSNAPAALLWVMPDDNNWQARLDLLSASPLLSFTAAVPPHSLTKTAAAKLAALVAKNKVEVASRLQGDIVLPLLFNPSAISWQNKPTRGLWPDRIDEAPLPLYRAREAYSSAFNGNDAAGWVPAGGGITPQLFELSAAYNFKWVAGGPGDRVRCRGGVCLVPFTRVTTPEEATLALAQAGGKPVFIVVDQSLPKAPQEDLSPLFMSIINGTIRPAGGWQTVSSLLAALNPQAELGDSNFPAPWTGDYSLWASLPRQSGAILSISKAIDSFSLYRNSRGQNPKTVRRIENELSAIESGANLLALATTATPDEDIADQTESSMKASLGNVYRLCDMPIPPSFLRSFSEMAGGGAASSRIAALNTPVSITSEGQSLTITASTAVITGDEPAAKFKTDALKVDWSNRDAIIFTIRAKDGDIASLQAAKLYFDIYIDINHRARSGSTALLPNRPMRTAPEDAWEYAITVNGPVAHFYRYLPPTFKETESFSVTYKNGEAQLVIPRRTLGGNPSVWGYMGLVVNPFARKQSNAVVEVISLDRIGATGYFLRLPKTTSLMQ